MSNKKNKLGFTVLEVLVSIGVIALLSGLFLANYRGGSRKLELSLNARKLASDIRLAQSRGLGISEYNGSIPAGGWGVSFDIGSNNKQYIIFADLNDNKQYDDGEANQAYGGLTVDLPANISLNNLLFNGNTASRLDITFVPPDPITNIYNSTFSPATTTAGTIILHDDYGNVDSSVKINSFGLIEVE